MSLQLCLVLYFAVIISCVRFILYLLLSLFPIGSLQLCLVLYFAVIVSYVCFILWLWYDTYFFHFSYCWLPVESLQSLQLWDLLLYFVVIISCVRFLPFDHQCILYLLLPLLLLCFNHLVVFGRSLIVLFSDPLYLLLHFAFLSTYSFSCAFSSSLCCYRQLRSLHFTYFFHFSYWIPSVVLTSLLCREHQFYLVHLLTSSLFLLSPFSCVFTSLLCCDHLLCPIILWLWYDTYFFPFYFLDPFTCA